MNIIPSSWSGRGSGVRWGTGETHDVNQPFVGLWTQTLLHLLLLLLMCIYLLHSSGPLPILFLFSDFVYIYIDSAVGVVISETLDRIEEQFFHHVQSTGLMCSSDLLLLC